MEKQPMKVAIIGEKSRASAWEKHLRNLSMIQEVVISPTLFDDDELKAVLLLDDSGANITLLQQCIKSGLHSFLVSKLPLDSELLDNVYHSSQEANVRVQFSHWPSLTHSIQWIRQQVDKPNLIQIKKELESKTFSIDKVEFDHHWTDEIAFIVKWLGGNIHRIESKPIIVNNVPLGLQLTMRFEDSSIASIQFLAFGSTNIHQRILSDNQSMVDYNVIEQRVKVYRVNDKRRVTIQEKSFDPANTVEWSMQQFFKSIQMNKETVFSPYDALQSARIVDKVRSSFQM